MIGDILWKPADDSRKTTEIGRYLEWLRAERALDFEGYAELWQWSVTDLEAFWASLWDFFGVRARAPYERVLGSHKMPGAEWFRGAMLNYAEHLFGVDEDDGRVAVVARSQTRDSIELTFGQLRDQVARARAGLQRLGVGRGDRVVAYLPNIPETLVAFIATASLGAVWASCAPEFGVRSVVDRFAQIEPKVLLAVAGYTYRDQDVDRRDEVAAMRAAFPDLAAVVHVPYGQHGLPDAVGWSELMSTTGRLEFEPVPFDHPLYVLFTSGTTGVPKPIVHGHGGMLLEHQKTLSLSWDLKPGDRLLWFTTTAWMMWNMMVSALLRGTSIVMIDGDPSWPDLGELWRLAEQTRPTMLGMSPPVLMNSRKAGLMPGRTFDLSGIRTIGSVGSPLPPEGSRYVYEQMGSDIFLWNGSGGTDVCSGIVGGSPLQPVYEGEISGRCLAVDAKAFDDAGNEVVGQLGELVITQPMPSMPVGFWNDPGGVRYRSSYFETYPGVWRHGDWILFSEYGSCVITGRSDATLNRGGVRLGTAELYSVVEELPTVSDSLVVHLEGSEGGAGELILFVVPTLGHELDEHLRATIRAVIRRELSPRHVPDLIVAVPAIPRTRTDKKLETPVKRILQGDPPDQVISRDALKNATAIDIFVAMAEARKAHKI